MLNILYIIIYIFQTNSRHKIYQNFAEPSAIISAVTQTSAELPCNLTSSLPGDKVSEDDHQIIRSSDDDDIRCIFRFDWFFGFLPHRPPLCTLMTRGGKATWRYVIYLTPSYLEVYNILNTKFNLTTPHYTLS